MSVLGNLVLSIAKTRNDIINSVILNRHNVEYESITINGIVKIYGHNRIAIGNGTIFNSGKNYNSIGGMTQAIIDSSGKGGILIGRCVGISNSALICKGPGIEIEDDVFIGGSCKIYDTDFHSISYEERIQSPDKGIKMGKVIIRRGAFIGAHCIVLKGVEIGEKAVVGAGSVVTKSIPANEVWAGNPARFVKKL